MTLKYGKKSRTLPSQLKIDKNVFERHNEQQTRLPKDGHYQCLTCVSTPDIPEHLPPPLDPHLTHKGADILYHYNGLPVPPFQERQHPQTCKVQPKEQVIPSPSPPLYDITPVARVSVSPLILQQPSQIPSATPQEVSYASTLSASTTEPIAFCDVYSKSKPTPVLNTSLFDTCNFVGIQKPLHALSASFTDIQIDYYSSDGIPNFPPAYVKQGYFNYACFANILFHSEFAPPFKTIPKTTLSPSSYMTSCGTNNMKHGIVCTNCNGYLYYPQDLPMSQQQNVNLATSLSFSSLDTIHAAGAMSTACVCPEVQDLTVWYSSYGLCKLKSHAYILAVPRTLLYPGHPVTRIQYPSCPSPQPAPHSNMAYAYKLLQQGPSILASMNALRVREVLKQMSITISETQDLFIQQQLLPETVCTAFIKRQHTVSPIPPLFHPFISLVREVYNSSVSTSIQLPPPIPSCVHGQLQGWATQPLLPQTSIALGPVKLHILAVVSVPTVTNNEHGDDICIGEYCTKYSIIYEMTNIHNKDEKSIHTIVIPKLPLSIFSKPNSVCTNHTTSQDTSFPNMDASKENISIGDEEHYSMRNHSSGGINTPDTVSLFSSPIYTNAAFATTLVAFARSRGYTTLHGIGTEDLIDASLSTQKQTQNQDQMEYWPLPNYFDSRGVAIFDMENGVPVLRVRTLIYDRILSQSEEDTMYESMHEDDKDDVVLQCQDNSNHSTTSTLENIQSIHHNITNITIDALQIPSSPTTPRLLDSNSLTPKTVQTPSSCRTSSSMKQSSTTPHDLDAPTCLCVLSGPCSLHNQQCNDICQLYMYPHNVQAMSILEHTSKFSTCTTGTFTPTQPSIPPIEQYVFIPVVDGCTVMTMHGTLRVSDVRHPYAQKNTTKTSAVGRDRSVDDKTFDSSRSSNNSTNSSSTSRSLSRRNSISTICKLGPPILNIATIQDVVAQYGWCENTIKAQIIPISNVLEKTYFSQTSPFAISTLRAHPKVPPHIFPMSPTNSNCQSTCYLPYWFSSDPNFSHMSIHEDRGVCVNLFGPQAVFMGVCDGHGGESRVADFTTVTALYLIDSLILALGSRAEWGTSYHTDSHNCSMNVPSWLRYVKLNVPVVTSALNIMFRRLIGYIEGLGETSCYAGTTATFTIASTDHNAVPWVYIASIGDSKTAIINFPPTEVPSLAVVLPKTQELCGIIEDFNLLNRPIVNTKTSNMTATTSSTPTKPSINHPTPVLTVQTPDHNGHCPQECARLTRANKSLISNRIGGVLSVTRALGDMSLWSKGLGTLPYVGARNQVGNIEWQQQELEDRVLLIPKVAVPIAVISVSDGVSDITWGSKAASTVFDAIATHANIVNPQNVLEYMLSSPLAAKAAAESMLNACLGTTKDNATIGVTLITRYFFKLYFLHQQSIVNTLGDIPAAALASGKDQKHWIYTLTHMPACNYELLTPVENERIFFSRKSHPLVKYSGSECMVLPPPRYIQGVTESAQEEIDLIIDAAPSSFQVSACQYNKQQVLDSAVLAVEEDVQPQTFVLTHAASVGSSLAARDGGTNGNHVHSIRHASFSSIGNPSNVGIHTIASATPILLPRPIPVFSRLVESAKRNSASTQSNSGVFSSMITPRTANSFNIIPKRSMFNEDVAPNSMASQVTLLNMFTPPSPVDKSKSPSSAPPMSMFASLPNQTFVQNSMNVHLGEFNIMQSPSEANSTVGSTQNMTNQEILMMPQLIPNLPLVSQSVNSTQPMGMLPQMQPMQMLDGIPPFSDAMHTNVHVMPPIVEGGAPLPQTSNMNILAHTDVLYNPSAMMQQIQPIQPIHIPGMPQYQQATSMQSIQPIHIPGMPEQPMLQPIQPIQPIHIPGMPDQAMLQPIQPIQPIHIPGMPVMMMSNMNIQPILPIHIPGMLPPNVPNDGKNASIQGNVQPIDLSLLLPTNTSIMSNTNQFHPNLMSSNYNNSNNSNNTTSINFQDPNYLSSLFPNMNFEPSPTPPISSHMNINNSMQMIPNTSEAIITPVQSWIPPPIVPTSSNTHTLQTTTETTNTNNTVNKVESNDVELQV